MVAVVDPWSLKDFDPKKLDFALFLEIYCQWMGWQPSYPQYRMAEWLQETEDENFRVLQAYRGASKSTVTSLYTPWRLSRDPMWTVLLVSARAPLVSRNSRYVRGIIEGFPICVNWNMKPDDPDLWRTTEFSVNRPMEVINPSCSVTSLESYMTGRRAKTLLMDDVEVQENTQSEDQRELLHQRIRALSMINSNHLFVGTPHAEDTVYAKLSENGNDYHFFRIPVEGEYINDVYVKNGVLANPDVELDGQVHDEKWIQEKRNSLTDGEFDANFLLIPSNVAQSLLNLELIHFYGDMSDMKGGLEHSEYETGHSSVLKRHLADDGFDQGYFDYWVDGKRIKDIVATWDPSSGVEGRDQSVLAVVAVTVEGDIYIMHIEILSEVKEGETFEIQCNEVLNVLWAFGLEKVYVEKNFNPSIAGELKRAAKAKHRKVSVKQIHASGGKGKFKSNVPVSKVSRIAKAIEPPMKTGLWIHRKVWKKTNIRQQLKDFPNGTKDDILDAVAWAIYKLSIPTGMAGDEDAKSDDKPYERPDKAFRKRARGMKINTYEPIKRNDALRTRRQSNTKFDMGRM